MAYNCYQCNVNPVSEEFQRCVTCQKSHQQLIEKLDSKPKIKEKKVKEKLYILKEKKQGIEVMTYMSEEDARANGIDITKLIPA